MLEVPSNNKPMKILVVDDDTVFRKRLAKAFSNRGFDAHDAGSVAEGRELAKRVRPQRAVVDLRMPGETGLQLVSELNAMIPEILVIVLTGYGSIATAVDATKRGAHDYLTKPCDAEQILEAFERDAVARVPVEPEQSPVPSLARVEWEHIHRVLQDCGGNISEAARRLGIHRRSLQRKLFKMQPLD
jgi:two-component system response regulator RegA